MRRALAILSLVVAIAAEGPYHLSRPTGPAFNLPAPAPLPSFPAPRPPPPPPPPAPRPLPQFQPQPQPNFGYQYQQPNIAPPVFQPAPQPQFPIHSHPQPIPQPLPQINYPQQPRPIPQQPIPIPQQPIPLPQPSQSYGVPQSRPPPPPPPAPIHHQPIFAPQPPPPQPHFHQPQPQPHYHQPLPQPQYQQPLPQYQQPQFRPEPLPQIQPQPLPQFQPQPLPQFQPQPLPQIQPQPLPQIQPQPLPQFQPQPLPQFQQPISIPQQQLTSQGYNYQVPQIQPQLTSNIPLQAQPLSNHISSIAPLSSYQADSNQYSGGHEQIHRDALDSVVVDRVQNIIKDSEHTSARNSGYLSLVSGVSLENAKPSVEISSFTHTSPIGQAQNIGLSQSSSALSIPSEGYSQSISSSSAQGGDLQASFDFLPQNKPATSYGPPN